MKLKFYAIKKNKHKLQNIEVIGDLYIVCCIAMCKNENVWYIECPKRR